MLKNNPACISQNIPDPVFTSFIGTAHKFSAREKLNGYNKAIGDREPIGEINLREINVPESDHKTPFPGLETMSRFAILFKSEMTISQKAIYVFSLNSDDGSILWIDGNKTIENDGTHKMTLVTDTLLLEKGEYPIRIWYFQGFPDRYGIQFKAAYLKEYEPLDDEKYNHSLTPSKMVLNSTSLPFENNSFELSTKGKQVVDSLAIVLGNIELNTITINGHTDNIGSEVYNQQLSLKRAETIKTILENKLGNKKIAITTNGFGEAQPITENDTQQGRGKNRRVEIIIERY